MTKIDVVTTSGSKSGTVQLKKARAVSPILISNVVLANLSNKRQSIAHTKTKGEVSGGGKKPWRQKGTGNARAGSSRSPLWIGGGTTFGPRSVRNFYKRINKKQRLVVINELLTKKAEQDNFKIVEKIDLSSGKTKDMVQILSSLGVDGNTLLVLDKGLSNSPEAEKIYGAGRNISFLAISSIEKINAFMILKYKWIVMTKKAFEELEIRSEFIKEAGEESKKAEKQENNGTVETNGRSSKQEKAKPVVKEKTVKKTVKKATVKKQKTE
ncbi:MAG: 50S ribosomal protein L4 [Patescibacteria group bacterium]|nr:50S ribosomal protein L4 [Patescibacteria group bacterium]